MTGLDRQPSKQTAVRNLLTPNLLIPNQLRPQINRHFDCFGVYVLLKVDFGVAFENDSKTVRRLSWFDDSNANCFRLLSDRERERESVGWANNA